MKRFDVISVDLFGTLVDVKTIAPAVWRQFLGDRYTPELAKNYWEQATDLFFKMYNSVIQDRQYVPPREIYKNCYSEMFPKIGIAMDPEKAAGILALEHANSIPFDETELFLNAVGEKYPLCLSSDTDVDMLGDLRYLYPFDCVFTSEELGAYKTGMNGRFFFEVLKHYNAEPGRVIHIGDSISDIIGAGEAGIVTCWLNRKRRVLPVDVKPDYEVGSLLEAAALLGVEISH